MKRGGHHSDETRERLRERNSAHWTAEERAKASERTRERMNNPAVRELISTTTKDGIARWRERRLAALRDDWRKSDKQTRTAFFLEIAASIAKAST